MAAAVARELRITAVGPASPLPEDFAANAFPVLEQLAVIGTPAIAHDVVEILDRIGSSEPKQTLLIIATAVESAAGYFREPEGARLVLGVSTPASPRTATAYLLIRNGPGGCGGSWKALSPRA